MGTGRVDEARRHGAGPSEGRSPPEKGFESLCAQLVAYAIKILR